MNNLLGSINNRREKILNGIKSGDLLRQPVATILNELIKNDKIREKALKFAEQKAYEKLVKTSDLERPIRGREDSFFAMRNMLYSINRAIANGHISPKVRKKMLSILVGKIILQHNSIRGEFRKKYGRRPPAFLTISPDQHCNLKCIGCYAASSDITFSKLEYDLVSKIIKEKTELWGSYFTVISGGEPLLWRSQGKDIIDIFKEHSNNYFLMYTNGTLIDKKMAERMAECGNVAPAISVEGFEKETDTRRGKGVYKKILNAFENLRNSGVPYGISVTAHKNNFDLLMEDRFINFYFEELGAIFGWIFQYMPIGRGFTLDLMLTPEQRTEAVKREQMLINEYKIFIADFWNSGPISNGCISAGRQGGYFYIDWNGDVMPCVFFPYSVHNIKDVYEKGGDLNTVLNSPFFEEIRKWQYDYGYCQPAHCVKNQITPCIIRDHYKEAYNFIKKHNAKPVYRECQDALNDKEYYEGLTEFDRQIAELTDPIWQNEYIKPDEEKRKALLKDKN